MKQTHSHSMGTEQVSAMVDGELSAAEWTVLWDDASSEDKDRVLLQLAGHHRAGEALRSPELVVPQPSSDDQFLARLRVRMADEPALVPAAAPVVTPARATSTLADEPTRTFRRPGVAANQSWWTWPAVAAALVLGVGVSEWRHSGQPAAEVAQGVPAVSVPAGAQMVSASASQNAVIRDPQLDQYLQQHQQLRGGAVIDASNDFVRTATWHGANR